jgi:TatD DNase family protein
MLIDSHCHLDYPTLTKDLPGVIARAREAGVAHMVNIGVTRRTFETIRTTAEGHKEVSCSFGVHPDHAHEEGECLTADEIINFTQHPKVVGIGETGLDYFRTTEHVEIQTKSFRAHLRASRVTGLPVIVHSRDAEEDTAKILHEEAVGDGPYPLTGVLHCFSSRRILAERALEIGFYVSLSGILTFKKSQELRDIARDIPLDRLLIETDAPYLAPEPMRGRPCEPAYVAHTARVLAEIKSVSFEEISRHTTDNFFKLFNKVAC